MLNNTVIVGRLVKDPEIKKLEDGKMVSNITLAVPRSYKNEQGVYDTDFIDCSLWGYVAETTAEYCRKGDIIGVRGKLKTSLYEKDGKSHKAMDLVAEKVSFLSSKTKETDVEESAVM